MNKIKFIAFFIVLVAQCSFAMQQVVVKAQSASGRSVKLDIGSLHGLIDSDQGELSLREGEFMAPKYEFLGSGRVVKVFQNYSYWYFPKLSPGKTNVGVSYSLQLRRHAKQGRTKISLTHKITSYESEQARANVEAGPDGKIPNSFIQEKQVVATEIYKKKKIRSADLEREVVSAMSTKKGVLLGDGYQDLLYQRGDTDIVDNSEISKKYNDELAKNQNIAQLKKISSKTFGYDELYYGRKNSFSNRESFIGFDQSVISNYRDRKLARQKIPAATIEMLKKEGALWSADMDTAELQHYLLRTGMAKERKRQENVIALRSGNEVSVYLSSNISNNYSVEDKNHQNNGLAIGFVYELHLVRAARDLERWSIDFMYERGNLNIDLGGINGRFTYNALATHLNYYFYNYPHSHNKFAYFLGVGVKRGSGDTTSVNLSKDYDYQMSAIPSVQLGVKYRIPAAREYEIGSTFGFGINARITYEAIRLSALTSIEDEFDSATTVNNIRADFGISIFF